MFTRSAKLLTTNNHKTSKGEKMKVPYKTYILYLSPFTNNSKGINLCPHASKGCSAACLFKSGFGGMYQRVEEGRRNKTEWFLAERTAFLNQLDMEIGRAIAKHKIKRERIAFRLNGTSDIRWEKLKVREDKNLFELYPEAVFYDYTKNPLRMTMDMPKNYHLTFSRSETNEKEALEVLKKGGNVAWVFRKPPKRFEGYRVIDGDKSDMRWKEKGKNVIVGLTYKYNTGKGSEVANKFAYTSGFVSV